MSSSSPVSKRGNLSSDVPPPSLDVSLHTQLELLTHHFRSFLCVVFVPVYLYSLTSCPLCLLLGALAHYLCLYFLTRDILAFVRSSSHLVCLP